MGLSNEMRREVATLLSHCFPGFLDLSYLEDPSRLLVWVRHELTGQIMSFCCLTPRHAMLSNGEYINNLITFVCTNPSYRRKGHMRYLFDWLRLEMHLKRNIDPILHLEVLKTNDAAIAFYESMGFRQTRSYGDMFLMQLDDSNMEPFAFPLSREHVGTIPDGTGIFNIHDDELSLNSIDCTVRALKGLGIITEDDPFTRMLRDSIAKLGGQRWTTLENIIAIRKGIRVVFISTTDPNIVRRYLGQIRKGQFIPFGFSYVNSQTGQMGSHVTIVGRSHDDGELICYEDQSGTFYKGDDVTITYLLSAPHNIWYFPFVPTVLKQMRFKNLFLRDLNSFLENTNCKFDPISAAKLHEHQIEELNHSMKKMSISSRKKPLSIR